MSSKRETNYLYLCRNSNSPYYSSIVTMNLDRNGNGRLWCTKKTNIFISITRRSTLSNREDNVVTSAGIIAAPDGLGYERCGFRGISVLASRNNYFGRKSMRTALICKYFPTPWCSQKVRAMMEHEQIDGGFIPDFIWSIPCRSKFMVTFQASRVLGWEQAGHTNFCELAEAKDLAFVNT